MIQQISDALKAKFLTLVGTGKPFSAIFDYHTIEVQTFPYLCFELTEFSAEIGDTCNNKRTFLYTALIFQDIDSGGRQEAVKILVKAMDDVILALDQDYTLGETVTQVVPVGGRIEPFVVGTGKCLVGTVQIYVETLAFIR